jgi:hypothetical protein
MMFYCERQPYFKNSNDYFRDNINHYEILYNDWMLKEYKTVLLSKMGSFSDVEHQWAFNSEADRTFFMLRWT